jgi:CheY-like chemotaxis protein
MAASGVCTRAPRAVHVLFVDDDEDACFAYRLIASQEGMVVALAHDGHEAIALANVLLPDVIVLDVGLRSPDGLDGFEVARRLRAGERTGAIPIAFLSGYDSERHVETMHACGCEGYLVKPCTAEDLLGLITELATRRAYAAHSDEAVASLA